MSANVGSGRDPSITPAKRERDQRVERYLNRAAEMRALASVMKDVEAREAMATMADSFENMAQTLTAIELGLRPL